MQKRLKSFFAILALFPVLVLFQNCTANNIFSASGPSQTKNNGNGGTYDGKLTFAQMVPGFKCENTPAPKSILRRDLEGQWTLTVNEPAKCGAILNQIVVDVTYDNSSLIKYNGADYGVDNTIPESSTTVLNFVDEYLVIAGADHNSSDLNVGDGICANAVGLCSLKAAVEEANSHPSKAQNIILPTMDTTINWSIVPRVGSSVGIYGAGMANTIIREGSSNGLVSSPSGMGGASGLFTIKDLSLQGASSSVAFTGSALSVYGSVFVKNVDFQNNLSGAGNPVIYAGVSGQHLTIEDSWIRNNSTTAIQIFAPESVTVRNTQIRDNIGRGVWVDNGSWNIKIFNSYIVGNTGGVTFRKCYSGCLIDTTEITDNLTYGLEIYVPNSSSLSADPIVRNSNISWNAISSGANIKFDCDLLEPRFLRLENSYIFRGGANLNPNCEYTSQNNNFSILNSNSSTDDGSCSPALTQLPPVTR